jgi:branched-chain amino acid transport system substrate-binding protein
MKSRVLFVVFAFVLASCTGTTDTTSPTAGDSPAAEVPAGAPEVCASDKYGCAVIPAGQTVKIGMGAPITGDYASFGVDISQGASIAVTDAGTVEGFPFELVAQDTQGTPEGGASVANKLATDPTIVAIAGHIFSGSTEAAMPIYEKAGIPMMSPSATNPPLTTLGSTVFNRIAFTDAVQGKFAAEYLYNKLGFRKIAVVHDGGAYGQGLADVVRAEFTALGGEVVGYEAITPGETDYTATLSALAAKNPEAIYFGVYVAEGVVLANNMKQSGLENVVFFGCDGTYGSEFVDKTGANGEGAYAASLIPPESEAKKKFDADYLAAFGIPTGSLTPYSWGGYDAATVLMAKVKEVAVLGADGSLYVPRGALVEAVRNTSGFASITGDITCNDVGECNTAGPTFYVIEGGEWVQAEK